MIDAFTTDTNLQGRFIGGVTKIVVAAKSKESIKGKNEGEFEFFELIDDTNPLPSGANVCLSSMLVSEKTIDTVTEFVLKNKANFMVTACRALNEVGIFDAKFNLSPIMLLHKLGLLSNAKIVGGIYLDNDDVDLMVQENASLILTPSFDAINGFGIPNAASYLKRNLKISLGSGDNRFNQSRGIAYEAEILQLLVSASLNKPNAISQSDLNKMCGSK